MSWLSSFVNNNRNFAGNALKNVAPLLALTGLGSIPAGYLLAGGAGALGQGIKKGSNIGDILHAGVDAGSMGSGLQTGAGMLAKSGLAGGQSAALQQMANQGSGMAGFKNAFAPGSQAVGGSVPMPMYGAGQGVGIDPQSVAGMGGGPGIQTGMSSLNPAMAPGVGAPIKSAPMFSPATPTPSPWYKQMGENALNKAMQDPLDTFGNIASLPYKTQLNDASVRKLQTGADVDEMTAEQLRQQKANMDALRAAMTARYNNR